MREDGGTRRATARIGARASMALAPDTERTTMPSSTFKASKTAFGTPETDVVQLGGGRDSFFALGGNDSIDGGAGRDLLAGGAGNDLLLGGGGRDTLRGGDGRDTLDGGGGRDVLEGGLGIDALTGGAGRDLFVFGAGATADPSTPVAVNLGGSGVTVKNSADAVTDFRFGEDRVVLDLEGFGIEAPITFARAVTTELGDANFIVQLDPFANAGAAAAAIAANPDVTADEGFFVYFNTTLGFNRLVHSTDLGDGGQATVLANFTDQNGPEGLAEIARFSPGDFLFV